SKTNQRGLNDRDGQAETISLPNNKHIIDDYEFFFTKQSATAVSNFYLKLCTPNELDFSGKWFYTRALPEHTLKSYFQLICEMTNIEIGNRNISNHSGRKMSVQVLKGLGFSNSVVMSITRHKMQQGLASYKRPKMVMQQQGLSGFFNALSNVTCSQPESVETDQGTSNQATTPKGIYGDFTLASDYVTFDTDMLNDDLTTNNNLPKSPRSALSNLDQNVQKESISNSGSESLEPKQIQDQISGELGSQKQQMDKEALDKFLTGNVFHNCTFNFSAL
ncbi:2313_t:CDS:2, partial [Gigaspora rosea]